MRVRVSEPKSVPRRRRPFEGFILLAILAIALVTLVSFVPDNASASAIPAGADQYVLMDVAANDLAPPGEATSLLPVAAGNDLIANELYDIGGMAIPAHLAASVDFVVEPVATNDFATVSMTNTYATITDTGKSNTLNTRDEFVLLAAIALTVAGLVAFGSAMARRLGFRSDDAGRLSSMLNSELSIDGAIESRRISKRFGAPMRRPAVLTSFQGASIVT